jgi:hypothetical protein
MTNITPLDELDLPADLQLELERLAAALVQAALIWSVNHRDLAIGSEPHPKRSPYQNRN